jgi:hypothetical protein
MERRIMIVGNGEIPEGAAEVIDLADLVIRFNDCRSIGAGGSRTDIVAVCNTGRPAKAMTSSDQWRQSDPVRQASSIWSVRNPEKFLAMRPGIVEAHPELEDFCDDYSADFEAFALSSGKEHVVLPAVVHDKLDDALRVFATEPYVCPSSGLIAIAHILDTTVPDRDRIMIAGFGHTGWDGHPFAAEKQLVDAFEAEGRLTRISPTSIFSASDLSASKGAY